MKFRSSKKILNLLAVIFAITFIKILNVNALDITVDNNVIGTIDPNSKLVTNQGEIEVSSIGTYYDNGKSKEDTFKAYKVIDVYYNKNSNNIIYEFTTDFKEFLSQTKEYKNLTIREYSELSSGDIKSDSTQSVSELDKLTSLYATYIKKNNISGIDLISEHPTASIQAPAGSYLILPVVTMGVYTVMVGNIEFKVSNGIWNLTSAKIKAKYSETRIHKRTPVYLGSIVEIGEEYEYILEVYFPKYPTNATNKIFTVKDVASNSINFSDVSLIEIYNNYKESGFKRIYGVSKDGKVLDENNNEVATITIEGQEMIINFNVDNIIYDRFYIYYKAKLNNNATVGTDNTNENTVTLTYSNDPYGTGTKTKKANTSVTTFGLEIFKYENNNRNKPLSGAVFEIYRDKECTQKVGTTTPTNEQGIAYYKGLGANGWTEVSYDFYSRQKEYYLKEIKAPNGYNISNEITVANIGYNIVSPLRDLEDEGTMIGELPGYYRVEIPSNKIGLLPVTGGTGTILFTVMGLILISSSIYYYLKYKSKRSND